MVFSKNGYHASRKGVDALGEDGAGGSGIKQQRQSSGRPVCGVGSTVVRRHFDDRPSVS